MEPITADEANEVRRILRNSYGPTVQTWNINYSIYELLGQLITKSRQCTRAMHLVPRPWDFSNPIKWAQKQVRQAIVRYLHSPEGRHYVICMKAAALPMRADFEAASLEL